MKKESLEEYLKRGGQIKKVIADKHLKPQFLIKYKMSKEFVTNLRKKDKIEST